MSTGRAERPDDGAVMVVTTVVLSLVLLTVGAMAVDLGNAFARREQVQRSADLAALAGAAKLPDLDAARSAAVASLCAGENAVLGWSIGTGTSCAAAAGWASDGDESNGEIEFYGDPVPLDGERKYRADQRITAGGATSIRVVTPPARVQFGLAGLVPNLPTSVAVNRSATATTGTPVGNGSGLLPFFLTLDDLPGASGVVCLVDANALRGVTGCPATGTRRGWVNEGRADTPRADERFLRNTRSGMDHAVHAYPLWPCGGINPPQTTDGCPSQTPLLDVPAGRSMRCQTPTLASGTFALYPGALPTRETNCLLLTSVDRRAQLKQGLITDGDARLTRACTTVTAGAGHGTNATIDANRLVTGGGLSLDASLLDPSLSLGEKQSALAALFAGGVNPLGDRPLFSPRIFDCPRLALLPRLQVLRRDLPTRAPFPPNLSYPVHDFRYVWIGSDDSDNGLIWGGGNTLQGLRAYLIDASFLPGTSDAASTEQLTSILDPRVEAPRVSVLIRDEADPSTSTT